MAQRTRTQTLPGTWRTLGPAEAVRRAGDPAPHRGVLLLGGAGTLALFDAAGEAIDPDATYRVALERVDAPAP